MKLKVQKELSMLEGGRKSPATYRAGRQARMLARAFEQ